LADLADKVTGIDRAVVTTRIEKLEADIKVMESGSTLDKAILRLDQFRAVDRHLTGTAMH
jgi:F-type H+-transporting ATPase subunit epsilon